MERAQRAESSGGRSERRGGPWGLLLALAAGLLLALLAPPAAFADATVKIRVLRGREPVEATVTLTLEGGESRTCRTRNGACQMQIPGGQHYVRAQPRGTGAPSPDRRVTVPPTGEVTLLVHLP